jgi:protocatechuate 3,4-dioxygenase beta subunit
LNYFKVSIWTDRTMGAWRILFPVFLLLALSFAQQGSNNLFKVEGTVVNSLTGRPIPRALVEMSGRAMLSGSEGEFAFDGVSPGQTEISLTKPGYFSQGTRLRQVSRGAAIEVAPDTGKIVLKLAPEAVIFGHVTGDDEEPLEGALIEVLALVSVNGQTQLQLAKSNVRTDEDGNYRVAGLFPGRYIIAVKTQNPARRILGVQTTKTSEAYPLQVYHPQAKDLASATVMDLSPGQRAQASFSLSLGPAFKLAGTVATPGEWLQVNVPELLDSMDRLLLRADQFEPKSGSFEFRSVPAGTYRLRCSGLNPGRYNEYSERSVTVSQPVTNLKLVLKHRPRIPVEFHTELTQPRSSGPCPYNVGDEIHQAECSDMPPALAELTPARESPNFKLQWRPANDSSGFGISGVSPGKYVVYSTPAGPWYVQSLRSGHLDLLREELVVPEEGSVAPIQVVLRDDWARLEVQVHGAAIGKYAVVVVIPDAHFSDPLTFVTNKAKIQWGAVPPGDYRVLAFDSMYESDYTNREALTPYLDKAANVRVSANQKSSVAVDLIRTGE